MLSCCGTWYNNFGNIGASKLNVCLFNFSMYCICLIAEEPHFLNQMSQNLPKNRFTVLQKDHKLNDSGPKK